MSLRYSHLLIPDRADYAPQPGQVAAFLQGLVALGSAPLQATFRIGRLSGKFRTGTDALTGEKLSIPRRDFAALGGLAEMPEQLADLDDYDVEMSGQGPAKLPPFKLYNTTDSEESEYRAAYGYEVRCCLRRNIVSTCETPIRGSPCLADVRTGIFHHPRTGTAIEVPNAGCARFWIEFQCGKWLCPRVDTNLNLLQPEVLNHAVETFGTAFVQGCAWE
jgi:hypothetical protein